jgi:DNA-binding NtrC family response regulator
VRHFVQKHQDQSKGGAVEVSDEVLELLQQYDWPGNVRELENCIVRAMVLAKSDTIEVEELPPEIHSGEVCITTGEPRTWDDVKAMKRAAKGRVAEEIERTFVEEGLRRNRGNVSRSSEDMGIDRRQLQNMIRKYQINPQDYH